MLKMDHERFEKIVDRLRGLSIRYEGIPKLSDEKMREAEAIRQDEYRKRFVMSPKAGENWQSMVQHRVDSRINGAKSAMEVRLSGRSSALGGDTPKSKHTTIISVQ